MGSLKGFTEAFPEIELALGVTDRTVDLVAEGIDCVLRIDDLRIQAWWLEKVSASFPVKITDRCLGTSR